MFDNLQNELNSPRTVVIDADDKHVTTVVETEGDRIVMAILLIVLPPLAVMLKRRGCSGQMCLNIFLYCCFFFPAYCHAVWYCFIRNTEVVITPTGSHVTHIVTHGDRINPDIKVY